LQLSAELTFAIDSAGSKRRRDDVKDDMPTSAPLTAVSTDVPSATTTSAEAIACRAYELFLERGGEHGLDLDDWFRAERELYAPDQEATSLTRELNARPAN
jgi:Protein of unknown function (DUF2934)